VNTQHVIRDLKKNPEKQGKANLSLVMGGRGLTEKKTIHFLEEFGGRVKKKWKQKGSDLGGGGID